MGNRLPYTISCMEEKETMSFKTEGDPAFPVKDTEKEDSAESSTEETNVEDTQSDEGDNSQTEETNDGNFAKHPRWKEREDDWKKRFNEQEKRHIEEIAKLREAVESVTKKTEISTDIPPWFGGDEKQWKEFQAWDEQRIAKAKEAAIQDIQSKTESEQKAITEATEYFESQLEEIQQSGEKVDRNKLLKFTLDNDLVDSKGRWNYKAAFKLMKASKDSKKSDAIEEKKKIASASTSEKTAESKPKPYATPDDFKGPNRPW